MLMSVVIIFLVLSFTGLADLSTSLILNKNAHRSTLNIQKQFVIESKVNEALWKINRGDDDLINLSAEGVTIAWDAENYILSVAENSTSAQTGLQVELVEETPFSNAIAARSWLSTDGYFVDAEPGHPIQRVERFPTIDPSYFILNRAVIHHGKQDSWSRESLEIEGIHIFLGNDLEISGLELSNSTLVFVGKDIRFTGRNTVRARVPLDSSPAEPALVFMNPAARFMLKYGTTIEGAIYSAGHLYVENAALTGPILANSVALTGNVDIRDDEHPEYYRWQLGFGNQPDYDWPKYLARWHRLNATPENS